MKLKYYYRALRYEFPRVIAWHKRHDPCTKKHYTWLEALRAVIENPPYFDISRDEDMEK